MPYIPKSERLALNPAIDMLAAALEEIGSSCDSDTAFAGRLNYAITRLCLRVNPARRYWAIALVTGVLENVKQEFYRRYAAPYEDDKIAEHGDVYDD
jgi:hypothetical protein